MYGRYLLSQNCSDPHVNQWIVNVLIKVLWIYSLSGIVSEILITRSVFANNSLVSITPAVIFTVHNYSIFWYKFTKQLILYLKHFFLACVCAPTGTRWLLATMVRYFREWNTIRKRCIYQKRYCPIDVVSIVDIFFQGWLQGWLFWDSEYLLRSRIIRLVVILIYIIRTRYALLNVYRTSHLGPEL